jgi:hypothetical protein
VRQMAADRPVRLGGSDLGNETAIPWFLALLSAHPATSGGWGAPRAAAPQFTADAVVSCSGGVDQHDFGVF